MNGRTRTAIFWSLLVIFMLSVCLMKVSDTDVWWHMQIGKTILAEKSMPDFTEFYFTPVHSDFQDLRFTFIGDILLYLAHLAGGDAGLQVLLLAVVLGSCLLLARMAGPNPGGWHLLAIMAFMVGTQQTQLIRNAMFSLIFTVLVFYLWQAVRFGKKQWFIWLYPVLLGIWATMHGSYLLGFILTALLFLGDVIDLSRERDARRNKLMVCYLIVIVLSFGAISFKNPSTWNYINPKRMIEAFRTAPFEAPSAGLFAGDKVRRNDAVHRASGALAVCDFFVKSTSFENLWTLNYINPGRMAQAVQAVFNQRETSPVFPDAGFFTKVKFRLNNTVFKTAGKPTSYDFMSPFSFLHWMFVKVALISGVVGLAILALVRPLRLSLLFPYIGVLILGLGYLRMAGYVSLAATATVFIALRTGEFRLKSVIEKIPALAPFVVAFLLTAAGVLNAALDYPTPVRTPRDLPGIGRTPLYSDTVARRVLAEFPDHRTFTTIDNGGYLLYRWHPRKKVFADGFFAPHGKLIDDLTRFKLGSGTPAQLREKYGIDSAIVDINSRKEIEKFMDNGDWRPLYMDEGNLFFLFDPEAGDESPVPELLIGPEEIVRLPAVYRKLLADNLFSVVRWLIQQGRLKDAGIFYERHVTYFKRFGPDEGGAVVGAAGSLIDGLTEVYGQVNSPAIQYEWLHNEALRNERHHDIIEYGRRVLDMKPDRRPVMFNIALALIRLDLTDEGLEWLDRLLKIGPEDRNFWKTYRTDMAKIFLNAAGIKRKQGQYNAAYTLMSNSVKTDSAVLPLNDLYHQGIALSREASRAGNSAIAAAILNDMARDFWDSSKMLNNIAWYLLDEGADPEQACKFAGRVVELMETSRDPMLDLAFDTLAEAFYRLKSYDKMRIFEAKALDAAPPERKGNYRPREIE